MYPLKMMTRLQRTLALHLLVIQTLLSATIKCLGPEDGAGSSVPAVDESAQFRWKEELFQSVALEMILFPIETDTDCQGLCKKWFSTFNDFIRKPQRGISMLRQPMTLSKKGMKVRPIKKAEKKAEQAFLVDPCLYQDRYCIASADVWLAPFTPDQLCSTDSDIGQALNTVKSLARDTMHLFRPMMLQSESRYFFGQCCMCRKFAIFSTVRISRPNGSTKDKDFQRRKLREYPDVECQPNDICHRFNERLFGLNQRSNQWFCNSAFVVKGIPGQGIKDTMAKEAPKHCPCELSYANPLTFHEFKTVCFSPESILDGIVDAGIRTLEQGQRELQITSLRTVTNDESSMQIRVKPTRSKLKVVQSQISPLDDYFIQNSHPSIASERLSAAAVAGLDSNFLGHDLRSHFFASSIFPQAQSDTLGEPGQAYPAMTHREVGELDLLASQIARQGHRQLQPHQQMIMPRQQMYVNPVLDSSTAQAASLTYDMNLDSSFLGFPQSQRFFPDLSSARTENAVSGSSSRRQTDRSKRKANEVELSERLRASRASIEQSEFSELGAAVDTFLQSDDDSDSLDFMLQRNRGTTLPAPEPQPLPLQEPLSQLRPEEAEVAVDLDSIAAAEEEIDISDLFFL